MKKNDIRFWHNKKVKIVRISDSTGRATIEFLEDCGAYLKGEKICSVPLWELLDK